MKLRFVQRSPIVKESYKSSAIVAFDLNGSELGANVASKALAANPHITLVYLGDVTQLDKDAVSQALTSFGARHAGISGEFNGFALFAATSDNDNSSPVVALFDSAALPAFRQALLMTLRAELAMELTQNHGFTPHMTLGYTDDLSIELPSSSVTYPKTFNELALFWGDEISHYPLSGDVVEKEVPLMDDNSKSALVIERVALFQGDSDALTERLYNGDISLGEWEEGMKGMIKSLHTATGAIGKGSWADLSKSDWGRIGAEVKSQYRYLHGFAEYIATNREDVSLEALQARARMYGNASRYTAALLQAGPFAGGTRRKKGSIPPLPWIPGDGSTECLVNCKCRWELSEVGRNDKFKMIKAVWHMTHAEHCEDCPDRQGHEEFRKLPLDMDVPQFIGMV
jgi:2'-5' RNA ligase